jgi:hypothetical protein
MFHSNVKMDIKYYVFIIPLIIKEEALIILKYVLFLRVLWLRRLIYQICSCHDIAGILLKLVLNTNQLLI